MNRRIGVIFSYLLMLIEILSSLLFTPFLIRSFGQSEYGVYSLTVSITSYLLLLDLGIGNAIIRYITKYRVEKNDDAERNLKGILIIFYSIICLIGIVIGIVLSISFGGLFSSGLSREETELGRTLLLLVMLNSSIALLTTPYSKIILAYEYYSVSKLLDISKIVFRIGISVFVLLMGGRSIAIASVNLSSTIIFSIITVIICNKKIPIKPIFSFKNKTFLKEIIGYSTFVFLQMIAYQINAMTDHILLGILSSSIILAVYQVGANLSTYFQSFSNAFNGVLQPSIVRLVEDKSVTPQRIENEMIKISRLLFMFLGIIFVVFLVNGKSFIRLWVGEDYAQSYIVAVILLFPLVFTLSQRVGTHVLWAIDKHKVQALLQLIIAVVNIGTSLLLIIFFDNLIGAALGTAIAGIVGDYFLLNYIFKKEIKINVFSYNFKMMKNTIIALAIAGISGYCFSLVDFQSLWLSFILNCLVMLIVFFVCMMLFGFNKYEKHIISNIWNKIFVRN